MKSYITPSVDIINIDATIMSDWGSLNTGGTSPNNQHEMEGGSSENDGTDYYDAGSFRTTLWGDN